MLNNRPHAEEGSVSKHDVDCRDGSRREIGLTLLFFERGTGGLISFSGGGQIGGRRIVCRIGGR